MNSKEKQIVNEAIAIIAGECKSFEHCEDGCAFYLGKCMFERIDFNNNFPSDLSKPFKTKKQRNWLSGKEVEVLDNG